MLSPFDSRDLLPISERDMCSLFVKNLKISILALICAEMTCFAAGSENSYFWSTRAGADRSVSVQCLKLVGSPEARIESADTKVCLEKLPVKFAKKDDCATRCGAFTAEGVFIQEAPANQCGLKPAIGPSGSSCRPKFESSPFQSIEGLTGKLMLAEGGGTSGGGDSDGLAAATRTLFAVTKAIRMAEKGVYTEEEKKKLLEAADKLKILSVDEDLLVKSVDAVQNSTAYSTWTGDSPITLLNRGRWNKIEKATDRENLLHHELAVLAGLEKTGDYRLTAKFAEFRKNSWKFREERTQICTVSLFQKKKTLSGKEIPGEALGVASIVMDHVGAKSDWAKIGNISDKREVKVLYVIDSGGYLRLKIVEVDRQEKGRGFLLENQKALFEEGVLIDPYSDDFYPGSSTKNVVFGDYFMSVSCSSQ